MAPQISLGVHCCVCSPDLPFPGRDRGRRRLLHPGRVLRQRGSLTGVDSCEAPGKLKGPVSSKACHVQGQGWIRHKGLTPEPGLAHRAGAQSRRSRPEHLGARMQNVGGWLSVAWRKWADNLDGHTEACREIVRLENARGKKGLKPGQSLPPTMGCPPWGAQ